MPLSSLLNFLCYLNSCLISNSLTEAHLFYLPAIIILIWTVKFPHLMNVFHDFDVSSKASDLTRTLYQVTEHNFHSGNFMDYNHLVLFKVINN